MRATAATMGAKRSSMVWTCGIDAGGAAGGTGA
jgi:hypothetical protein